jgi:cellulose synthase/poly-beta-1,6-N-acetylglucosamine synthase-like glycosyltransferase
VTEDADLGVRLARHGYVTELVPTVTHEEATHRPWAWVRQRSRWLKGFLVTYLVHMRDPGQLLRDLGPKRFLGLQAMFLATFCQFACAPLLWTFWLTYAGITHPVQSTLGSGVMWAMIGLFVTSELLNLAMGFTAVSGRKHRHLLAYVPTMMVYFTLGTLAAYKALWELVRSPFFWDKTQHGTSDPQDS